MKDQIRSFERTLALPELETLRRDFRGKPGDLVEEVVQLRSDTSQLPISFNHFSALLSVLTTFPSDLSDSDGQNG
jgi:hypothetical protein